MQTYPTIPRNILHTPIIAFDKLDGSNIRAEWNPKQGFTRFGTRKRLLTAEQPVIGEAIQLFQEKYADDLSRVFKDARYQKATAFFEFYGDNSFAGFHEEETHNVTLFDVHVYKRGVLPPDIFLDLCKNIETAKVLYQGNPTQAFVDSVESGTLEGMTFEGVICKGALDNRGRVSMFKVKNKAWLNKLRSKYGSEMYQRLM